MANDYLIDRDKQLADSFTGIRGIREQDLAVQEDQRGAISERTREHLGSSDTAVIAMRYLLMKAATDLQQGLEQPSASNAEAYRVRSVAMLAERSIALGELEVPSAALLSS